MSQKAPNSVTDIVPPASSSQQPSPQQKAWARAVDEARQELGPERFAAVASVADYNACLKALESHTQKQTRKRGQFRETLDKCLQVLKTFDRAIATCCQAKAEVACLIWGSVQAVLIVAAKYRSCSERIVDMLQQVTGSMPRFDVYMRLFPTHTRIQERLVDVYRTFFMFCARAIKFIESHKYATFFNLVWSPLEEILGSTVKDMARYIEQMDKDANAAHIAETIENHAEVRARLQGMVEGISGPAPRRNLPNPVVIVPESHNDNFVGRSRELLRLHSEFSTHASAYPGQGQPCVAAICGPGGVGKTQLALRFLYENKAGYRGRFWISAESKEIIQRDVASIGRRLASDLGHDAVDDLDKAVKKAREWLETTDDTWLLVFDNVDDPTYIQKYLPRVGHGSVIVTTRDHITADALGQLSKKIDLQGMDKTTAVQLLHLFIPEIVGERLVLDREDDRIVSDILDELDGLPLFICLMGCYMLQKKCTPRRYQEILQKESERLYTDTVSVAPLPYGKTMAASCNISIRLLSDKDRYLFGVLAVFQTDAIQEEMITASCSAVPRLEHLADRHLWNEAVYNLEKINLITVSGKEDANDATGRILSMHRVMKRHALHLLSADRNRLANTLTVASNLLHAKFPHRPPDGGTMTKAWAECELWLPHVLSLKLAFATTTGQGHIPPPQAYAEVLCNCTWYMWERDIKDALTFALDALDVCREALSYARDSPDSPDSPDSLDSNAKSVILWSDMHTMVGALRMSRFQLRRASCDAFEEALATLERFAEARSSHDAPLTLSEQRLEQRLLANAYNNAGVGHLVLHEWDAAQRLFGQAENLKARLGDKESMPYDFAIASYNRCRLKMEQGHFGDALDDCLSAIALIKRSNGLENFRALQFRFTHADLVAMNDIDEGLRLHKAILGVRLRIMGLTGDTAVSCYALSCVYQRLGRFNDSLNVIALAIKILAVETGTDDRLARAYFRRSLIYDDMGQRAEADSDRAKAKAIRRLLVGSDQGTAAAAGDDMEDYDELVSYYFR